MRQSSNGNRQWLSDQQRTTPSFLQCLGVPPGAPMKSHMTFAEVKKKTKMWLTFESMLNVQLIVSEFLEY